MAGTPAAAATCQFLGDAQFGIEPPLAVDADCTDPDYNANTFVIDSTEDKSLTLPDGTMIAYVEVKGHFPATQTQASLPAGIRQSPTTASHNVVWQFPQRSYFRGRFFQQTYPLPFGELNAVDLRFAFESGGGYTVGISPGNPMVGYRVPAAAAKLARDYAGHLYGDTGRIFGYLYGQSGGSVQSIGAAHGTTGVWDGIVPVVIATDGLNVHSFMWGALYALAVPEAKRRAIALAAAPGSGGDIYAGLTSDERAVLDELLGAGFPRSVLETMQFSVPGALQGASAIWVHDPAYEEEFWSLPGYEGANPPVWLAAAKVDGVATITAIARNDAGVATAISFDPATLPPLGSTGAAGLQFYVLGPDGTHITNGEEYTLNGNLEGATLTLADGRSDAALLAALEVGGRIRVNNRFMLAAAFYPRHSILDNGNPAYNQYRNADGTPRYPQRPRSAIPITFFGNVRAAGGLIQSGELRVRTVVFENLADGYSYPYVAGFFDRLVDGAMGTRADDMFRVYYQQNGIHGAFLSNLPGQFGTMTVPTGGTLHQVLLDLADWAERGIAPLPSTQYRIDAMNQIVLPDTASERGGYQPAVHLTANGADRAEVGVNQPVTLSGQIEMPPGAGEIVEYDWYLGGSDYRFEPSVKPETPLTRAAVQHTVSFAEPGEYVITLRAAGQRSGTDGASGTTPLFNIDRVRIVVGAGDAVSAAVAPLPETIVAAGQRDLWYVDTGMTGTQCIRDPGNVNLWRADTSAAARLRVFGPANAPSAMVSFAAGEATARLDTAAFPIFDGASMTIADTANGNTIGHVEYALLPARLETRQALADALAARGCNAQLALLGEPAAPD